MVTSTHSNRGALELSLAGKVALVTGAGSGIGRAIARLLARAGATVVVTDIDEMRAQTVTKEISATDGNALAITLDVRCEADVARAFARSQEVFGQLDILVNNAAWISPAMYKPFLERPMSEWDRTQEVNFRGVVLCCRAALPLLEASRGNIVNITSVNAQIVVPDGAAYCASKGAVAQLTRSLALEYARKGVRVNAVGPGWIDTPGVSFSTTGDDAAAAVDQLVPMGRLGKPEEIARAVVFLASEEFASYLTGSTIFADGGWLLR
jgi:NAD(P)-dependent dehydrogenase (short-subunit alcohol dehydrogenase family)